MADKIITLTIPSDKVLRVVDAMKGLYKIPQTRDEETGENTNDYTDNEWAEKCVENFIINTVQRHESRVAREASKVSKDSTLIS